MEGDIHDCSERYKLRHIKKYVDDMLSEFEEQLKEEPSNFIAAFAVDNYKEIRRELNKSD